MKNFAGIEDRFAQIETASVLLQLIPYDGTSTWGKLAVDTPKFIIESDATIVASLVFAYLLGW